MNLEIVTHCWSGTFPFYAAFLNYHISALVNSPPTSHDAILTVFWTGSDALTRSVLEYWSDAPKPLNVKIQAWDVPPKTLFRRSIGRNLAARQTEADWVWFADCDYFFLGFGLEDFLNSLADVPEDKLLAYPKRAKWSGQTEGQADADAFTTPGPVDVDHLTFRNERYNRAVGGIQFARGPAVAESGYCPSIKKYQTPCSRWRRTFEDRVFRSQFVGNRGYRVPNSNLFRLRHDDRGRNPPRRRRRRRRRK